MQKIILISGPIGSGKTTVARKLYESFNSASLIEADQLVKYSPWAMNEQSLRIKAANCNSLIQTYLSEGIQNIICEGYVQNQFELKALEDKFKSRVEIHLFWLDLSRKERQKRVSKRGQGDADNPSFMDEYEKFNIEPWPFSSETSKLRSIKVGSIRNKEIVKVILGHL